MMKHIGEFWRYNCVADEPRIFRPAGWFSLDDYVAVRICGIWMPARVIFVGGGDPQAFSLCLDQKPRICRPVDGCESFCKMRICGNLSQGDVVGIRDIERVILEPEPLDPINWQYQVSYEVAIDLLQQIKELRRRQ